MKYHLFFFLLSFFLSFESNSYTIPILFGLFYFLLLLRTEEVQNHPSKIKDIYIIILIYAMFMYNLYILSLFLILFLYY